MSLKLSERGTTGDVISAALRELASNPYPAERYEVTATAA